MPGVRISWSLRILRTNLSKRLSDGDRNVAPNVSQMNQFHALFGAIWQQYPSIIIQQNSSYYEFSY